MQKGIRGKIKFFISFISQIKNIRGKYLLQLNIAMFHKIIDFNRKEWVKDEAGWIF